MRQPPDTIAREIEVLVNRSRNKLADGDIEAAWNCLGDAHILSQPWPRPHVRVHGSMFGLGLRTRNGREVFGQLFRLVVAGPGSMAGRYPVGNSGRANVSAFAAAPLRPDLASLLSAADVAGSGTAGSDPTVSETAASETAVSGTAVSDPTASETAASETAGSATAGSATGVSEESGVLDSAGVRRLYEKAAPFYDVVTAPYWWIGADRMVKRTVSELRLESGATVVDLGTGTGRNLVRLAELVGPNGRVIGVDISPAMLGRARRRLDELGLDRVELVEADIANYEPPDDTSAVMSTFAIEMLPNYDEVISRLSARLTTGGRIAVTGMRHPDRWPEWIVRIGSALNRPFGVSEDYRSHRPWEAIEAHTTDFVYEDAFGGVVYRSAGTSVGVTS